MLPQIEVSLVYTKSGQGEKRKSGESEGANIVFTGECFSLNLGFRNFFCSQTMDSVLFQVSQKFCVYQRILDLFLMPCQGNFFPAGCHDADLEIPSFQLGLSASGKYFLWDTCLEYSNRYGSVEGRINNLRSGMLKGFRN